MKLSCRRGLHLVLKAHLSSFTVLHGFGVHECRKLEAFTWSLVFISLSFSSSMSLHGVLCEQPKAWSFHMELVFISQSLSSFPCLYREFEVAFPFSFELAWWWVCLYLSLHVESVLSMSLHVESVLSLSLHVESVLSLSLHVESILSLILHGEGVASRDFAWLEIHATSFQKRADLLDL